MKIQASKIDLNEAINRLITKDHNYNELLSDFPDIRKVIVNGLKSEIRAINNLNTNQKTKEKVRSALTYSGANDLNKYIDLFLTSVINVTDVLSNKVFAISELITRVMANVDNTDASKINEDVPVLTLVNNQ